LGAVLLDSLILGGAILVLFLAVAILGFVLGLVSDVLAAIVTGVLTLVIYVGALILFMLMEAGPYGQTPGKHVLGIKVVTSNGQLLSKGQSVGRYFAKIISGLPCYLGFLWPLWDAERRTFHDMMLDSRVVTTSSRAPGMVAIFKAPFSGPS
jgi:uncharacterized RDD family membrane protein YckC